MATSLLHYAGPAGHQYSATPTMGERVSAYGVPNEHNTHRGEMTSGGPSSSVFRTVLAPPSCEANYVSEYPAAFFARGAPQQKRPDCPASISLQNGPKDLSIQTNSASSSPYYEAPARHEVLPIAETSASPCGAGVSSLETTSSPKSLVIPEVISFRGRDHEGGYLYGHSRDPASDGGPVLPPISPAMEFRPDRGIGFRDNPLAASMAKLDEMHLDSRKSSISSYNDNGNRLSPTLAPLSAGVSAPRHYTSTQQPAWPRSSSMDDQSLSQPEVQQQRHQTHSQRTTAPPRSRGGVTRRSTLPTVSSSPSTEWKQEQSRREHKIKERKRRKQSNMIVQKMDSNLPAAIKAAIENQAGAIAESKTNVNNKAKNAVLLSANSYMVALRKMANENSAFREILDSQLMVDLAVTEATSAENELEMSSDGSEDGGASNGNSPPQHEASPVGIFAAVINGHGSTLETTGVSKFGSGTVNAVTGRPPSNANAEETHGATPKRQRYVTGLSS